MLKIPLYRQNRSCEVDFSEAILTKMKMFIRILLALIYSEC
ncbi:hypothetical protein M972_11703 [Acetivibrio thermocellus AD2]|jgi:hypothetical protein|uniref:Uncharacterized protein n=2 Tax=Acetivibrio thermocellus TaxID=1515 RepID=G2JCE5_ACET2|nr:hypothetical protein Clo1313_0664 [Acetivibrio thermocellus DSM 1313]AEO12467.1 hypothetical protein Cthe_3421 [Acetivibrio thermocellus ATCC 27405]ALX07674.1 hypothetical protein AD2_00676 [Acetivibrio thermocellus AD2]ANV75416.1 hypothetical protein LQRI_0675 [Acetivibrio thermocellus DSM 2360]CDG37591.1 hypothetical protein CTHBC1_3032 [Acetivibrio thermocellus BC1]SOD26786.1 hypothetical protein SAMN04515622_2883 [Acetivibrio thermocellus]